MLASNLAKRERVHDAVRNYRLTHDSVRFTPVQAKALMSLGKCTIKDFEVKRERINGEIVTSYALYL